jgi:hypothetical protein
MLHTPRLFFILFSSAKKGCTYAVSSAAKKGALSFFKELGYATAVPLFAACLLLKKQANHLRSARC